MTVDLNNPRAVALYIAGCNTRLEDRLAFAEAVLPLLARYDGHAQHVLYVDQILPKGLPAEQWLALASDHLAFLLPEISPGREMRGLDGVRADVQGARR